MSKGLVTKYSINKQIQNRRKRRFQFSHLFHTWITYSRFAK